MASKYDNILDSLSENSPWSEANEAALLEPFMYITSNPGKEIRGLMIEGFNTWLNVPAEKLQVIGRVVRMLHSASLLIDDIEDDSQLRRGEPVAHKIYGIPQTINTANYVYFLAYQELFSLRDPGGVDSASEPPPNAECNAVTIVLPPLSSTTYVLKPVVHSKRIIPEKDLDRTVTAELLSLHRGQGLEILWRDSLQCPTEEEYIKMVNNKTGGLFRIAIKLMMACATTNTDVNYVPLVNLIGIYFQIRDDYMNLQSAQYSTNKGLAEDLTEGKFSFPVVHGIRADLSNRQIINILQKRPTTPTLKHRALSYLEKNTKSFEYTLGVLRSLEKQTRDEIQKLGGNPGLEAIMDTLHIHEDGR